MSSASPTPSLRLPTTSGSRISAYVSLDATSLGCETRARCARALSRGAVICPARDARVQRGDIVRRFGSEHGAARWHGDASNYVRNGVEERADGGTCGAGRAGGLSRHRHGVPAQTLF